MVATIAKRPSIFFIFIENDHEIWNKETRKNWKYIKDIIIEKKSRVNKKLYNWESLQKKWFKEIEQKKTLIYHAKLLWWTQKKY